MTVEGKLDRSEVVVERGGSVGEDIYPGEVRATSLRARMQARDAKLRDVRIGHPDTIPLRLANVHELPLVQLRETDNSSAQFMPGDMLCPEATLDKGIKVDLWNDATGNFDTIELNWNDDTNPARTLHIILTQEPVIEPPPTLFATLLCQPSDKDKDEDKDKDKDKPARIAVPLHAQSPLPRRVNLADPARGHRAGLTRRHAEFVWYLSKPHTKLGAQSLFVIKSDRNGHLYLPEAPEEFFALADALPLQT